MSSDDEKRVQPSIRFGDKEIPTYEAWSKLEAANMAARHLESLNERFPELASEATRSAVKTTQQRLKSVEVLVPQAPKKSPELEDVVLGLLHQHSLEEVAEKLQQEQGLEIDMAGVVFLIGMERYCVILGEEVNMYRANALSDEQIAELWNETNRPVPGGQPRWNAASVSTLIKELGL
jgi:DNA polymerase III gamma/tau subunit